jgi:hypothetical protein
VMLGWLSDRALRPLVFVVLLVLWLVLLFATLICFVRLPPPPNHVPA